MENLSALHTEAKGKTAYRLHFHAFEWMRRPGTKRRPELAQSSHEIRDTGELSIKEALALLDEVEYKPTYENIWVRIGRFNKFFQSEQSVFAVKTAAAASVFATLSSSISLCIE